MDYYKAGTLDIPIIDADFDELEATRPPDAGYGLVPRDYDLFPEEMFAPPSEIRTIPESEWDARFDEQEATESSLEHLYLRGGRPAFVNLDQSRDGDCWAYSVGHSIMLMRLAMGQPLVRLNPHGVAAMLGRPGTGGWCGLSAQFARTDGFPEEGTGPGQWPLWTHNLKHDTPALRAAMKLHVITEDWVDLTRRVYDQNLTRAQVATCGFMNIPVPEDFNWWGHSVCQVRWVRIEPGSWGPLILNSWKNWGRFGLGVLRGSKAICNGAVATRQVTASVPVTLAARDLPVR